MVEHSLILEMMTHFGALDVAVTTEDRSDYTVIISCAITAEGKIFVEDVFRRKIESPDIIPKAKQIASKITGLMYV